MKKMSGIKIIAGLFLLFLLICAIPADNVKAAEDYRGWSQADKRWASTRMGRTTVKKSGCLVTSITKLSIQAGLKEADSFNVKTMAKWLNSHGGFTSGGALNWSKTESCVKGLKYKGNLLSYRSGGYSSAGYNTKLMNYIKNGYHLVIAVKYGGHWVAVDEAKSLATGKIYIMDSASSTASKNMNRTLSSCYSRFYRVVGFKGGKTAKPSVAKAKVTGISAKYYTGKSIKQSGIKVVVNGKTLKAGTHYTVSYKNNKYIGKATVTIKGKGTYTGTIKKTFNIKVKKGATYTVSGNIYKITDASTDGTGTVALVGTTADKESLAAVVVENNIPIGKKTFLVTGVETGAFAECPNLEKVTIGSNVKAIGEKAFYNCSMLKEIIVESSIVESVGENAFAGISEEAVLTFPEDATEDYKLIFLDEPSVS